MSETGAVKGLRERLASGEHVICAEGYVVELERRCWVRLGTYSPEVVLERPDVVAALHEEFVRAGSDVVEAYTYYGTRTKMTLLEREDETERLNREALRIAKKVAVKHGKLMAGNLSKTNMYTPGREDINDKVEAVTKEQVEWAVEEGADFIIGETFMDAGEALLALKSIKKYGKGVPAVITVMPLSGDTLQDGVSVPDCCRMLEEKGADVVGVNCGRGPDTMLPLLQEIRKVCKGPLACLPVPYRTTPEYPTYPDLRDPQTGQPAFPANIDMWICSREQISDFTNQVKELAQYLGLCCGNRAYLTRAMSVALGRHPPAADWLPDFTRHETKTTSEEFARARENMQQLYKSSKRNNAENH